MERLNVLVTQQKKTDIFTDVLSQDMNRQLLSIDANNTTLCTVGNETRHSLQQPCSSH